MLALPLLLALAVTADPPAPPAEAAPAIEEEGPQIIVAPPDLPGVVQAPPAEPFALTGFIDPGKVVLGAALTGGYSSFGLTGSVDPTLRYRGLVLGATVGGAQKGGADAGWVGLRTLGVLAGWGTQRGLHRGEALLGWGVAAQRFREAGQTTTYNGHFQHLQVGVDRAVGGGLGWRATVGLVAWLRSLSRHDDAGVRRTHSFGAAMIRLGIEAGG